MQTKISTKGQVVLPSEIRRRLGLQPGDALNLKVDGETIILRPRRKRRTKGKVVTDRITGLPVLTLPGAPILTSKQVKQILADFP
jgi:AbrB family looped-hinge helix DNA binding protein